MLLLCGKCLLLLSILGARPRGCPAAAGHLDPRPASGGALRNRPPPATPRMDRSAVMTSNNPGSGHRSALRFAAGLLLAGVVLSVAAGLLHPDREPANDHPAVFAEYAASADWVAVHLGQFAGMAVLIAGLAALYSALGLRCGASLWLGRFGLVAAGAALALYGVLQAVDGVALKHAVDAWAAAPPPGKPGRLSAPRTGRWLEWGGRGYPKYAVGPAPGLLGAGAGR